MTEEIETVLKLIAVVFSDIQVPKSYNVVMMNVRTVEENTNHEACEGSVLGITGRQLVGHFERHSF